MSFVVYKASAGSGKTFTLVKEYLSLALSDPSDPPQLYKRILAITFTNKAAAEMKERILRALTEISTWKENTSPAFLLTLLEKELELSKELLAQRAERLLRSLLHNYADFAVGTIDSFVHKIVRSFAHDLQLPMNFEIETETGKLLSEAIDLLIGQIGSDEQLTTALVSFAESRAEEEKSWNIERELTSFAGELLKDDGAVYAERLKQLKLQDFFKLQDELSHQIKAFEKELAEIGTTAIKKIEEKQLTRGAFFQGDKGIARYFEYLRDGQSEKYTPNSYVEKTIHEEKWSAGKASTSEQAAIAQLIPTLTALYQKATELLDKQGGHYKIAKLMRQHLYSLAVLNEIEKLLLAYKTDNNVLHISEFNRLIAAIVLSEPIPFIYERMGEKYNHYLIDEFQDTSVLQFQNLLPLLDNSLASQHFNMIVGDGKQAIYRWRGGEVEQFALLPNVHKKQDNPYLIEREQSLHRNYQSRQLVRNFRSCAEIIQFNNDVFSHLAKKLDDSYRSIYEGIEQDYDSRHTGGYIQVDFLPEEISKDVWMQQKTLEHLFQLQKEGFAFRDITVLCRNNADGNKIANHLTKQNIPVVSSDSLLIKGSTKVQVLNAFLQYLKDPENEIATALIVHYFTANNPELSFSEELLRIVKKETTLLTFLSSIGIDSKPDHLRQLGLYEMGEELVNYFAFNSHPDPYVLFFLDELLQFSHKKNNSLSLFLEWWNNENYQPSISIPEGGNAVRIMTIHKSKGLEFPVAILPYADWKVNRTKDYLWVEDTGSKLPAAIVSCSKQLEDTPYEILYREERNKTLLDNLNLLYVAFTRPEQRLYVLSGKQPSKQPDQAVSVTDLLIDYLSNISEYEKGKTSYAFGKPSIAHQNRAEQNMSSYHMSSINSNRRKEKVRIRSFAAEFWEPEVVEQKKHYGILVHKALARILTTSDIESSLHSMLNEGLIDPLEKMMIAKHLQKLLAHPEIAPYFTAGLNVRTEAEILLENGKTLRPDRILLDGDHATIIDFKTGKKEIFHHTQLDEYAMALKKLGFTFVQKVLIYIENMELLTLPS